MEPLAKTRRQLRHDLGNALGALRLRVRLVLADPACRAAQATNLEAIDRIVGRSIELFEQIRDSNPRAPKARKRKKTKKRVA